jgi:hypothetical protein
MSPSQTYRAKARELVEANKDRYPELLIEQLGGAMEREAQAVDAGYRMRCLAGVCLRMLQRADVKPQGDEQIAYDLAMEMTHADPRRMGGNGWVEPDATRDALTLFEDAETVTAHELSTAVERREAA